MQKKDNWRRELLKCSRYSKVYILADFAFSIFLGRNWVLFGYQESSGINWIFFHSDSILNLGNYNYKLIDHTLFLNEKCQMCLEIAVLDWIILITIISFKDPFSPVNSPLDIMGNTCLTITCGKYFLRHHHCTIDK